MRIPNEQINFLKSKVSSFDAEAKLYVFGSRTDDKKKGGDIDLLIKSTKLDRKDLRKLRIAFFDIFGEQKLDIVLDNGSNESQFIKKIQQESIAI